MFRTAALFASVIVLGGSLIGCQLGNTDVVIQGKVVDQATGRALSGASVTDGSYGGSRGTTTGTDGTYSYISSYEEHNVIATAVGYKPKTVTMTTNAFGSEPSKTIHFSLEKE